MSSMNSGLSFVLAFTSVMCQLPSGLRVKMSARVAKSSVRKAGSNSVLVFGSCIKFGVAATAEWKSRVAIRVPSG